MDVTDIYLLFLVSLSVAVFIILQNLEKRKKTSLEQQRNKTNKSLLGEKPRTDFFVKEVDDQVVGAEKDLIFEDFKKDGCEEIVERNETGQDCGNMGIMEDDYEILDDWEGVERTELEGLFGKAVVFVNNADQIDGDTILQLYGLQKVALEGPCHESQPMALKVSARSKWNAWQRLGNMSREMAMEKYVEILSMAVPDWRKVTKGATYQLRQGSPSTKRFIFSSNRVNFYESQVEGEGVDAVKETSETQTSTQNKDGVANEMLIKAMQRDTDPST